MKSPLVIAYGNSLREDDGVSFAVLDRVLERSVVPVRTMREPQLDLEFSDDIHQSSLVIFLDASIVGEPGNAEMTWVTPNESELARSHNCSPGALLAYTKAVHGSIPRAALVTVVGASFNFSESLTSAAQSGVPLAADMVTALLAAESAEKSV